MRARCRLPKSPTRLTTFNLNLPRYLDGAARADAHDIEAHLRGGIPQRDIDELQPFWQQFDGLRELLFAPHQRAGYASLALDNAQLVQAIEDYPAVTDWQLGLWKRFDCWFERCNSALLGINGQSNPKLLRAQLAESLLAAFEDAPLVDPYAIYQSLCSYWDATMGDDVDILIGDGWQKGAQPLLLVDAKEKPDLVVDRKKFACELVPPALIVARYFADERLHLDQLEAGAATLAAELDELREEHGGEEGYLGALKDDDGKFSERDVKTRLFVARTEDEADEEIALLARYLKLVDNEAAARKAVKTASERLDERTLVKYKHLGTDEVQELVADDKWGRAILAGLNAEIERALGELSGRASNLAARYAAPLPQLQSDADNWAARAQATWLQLGFGL